MIGCVQAVLELNSMIAPKAKLELRLKNFALQVWYAATWLQHEAFLDLFDLSLVKPYAKHVIVFGSKPYAFASTLGYSISLTVH